MDSLAWLWVESIYLSTSANQFQMSLPLFVVVIDVTVIVGDTSAVVVVDVDTPMVVSGTYGRTKMLKPCRATLPSLSNLMETLPLGTMISLDAMLPVKVSRSKGVPPQPRSPSWT